VPPQEEPRETREVRMHRRALELGSFERALNVADLGASIAFYTTFGFNLVGGNEVEGMVILQSGTHRIVLVQGRIAEDLLIFRCGQGRITKLAARLTAAGIALEEAPVSASIGDRALLPDGNAVHLVSRLLES
jgi:hypothetical protein